MNWLTNKFSKFFPKRHNTNSNSEKIFDEVYNDFDAFEYDENGFTIHYEDFAKRSVWEDIIQLNVYKVDLPPII